MWGRGGYSKKKKKKLINAVKCCYFLMYSLTRPLSPPESWNYCTELQTRVALFSMWALTGRSRVQDGSIDVLKCCTAGLMPHLVICVLAIDIKSSWSSRRKKRNINVNVREESSNKLLWLLYIFLSLHIGLFMTFLSNKWRKKNM